MRILGKSALTTDNIRDLLLSLRETEKANDTQFYFGFIIRLTYFKGS